MAIAVVKFTVTDLSSLSFILQVTVGNKLSKAVVSFGTVEVQFDNVISDGTLF
ncbi:hypothetical protein GM3709_3790 (plasmid) [Geminocystis sp. NIES-3709]|nr:hypothetical protein GM3709_3790 [Geminocystis sp. NIES-3709]